jgi:soluble lytic murein transglycosylase-like protein
MSLHHLEIFREGERFRIRDLDSTNGTFVNGERVTEAELAAPATIRLGVNSYEFSFVTAATGATDMDETLRLVPGESGPGATYDGLISDAVARARHARASGRHNETMTIMREALGWALHRSRKRSKRVIVLLAAGLIAVSSFATWKIRDLHRAKKSIDTRIEEIEAALQKASGVDADSLIAQLETYQGEVQQLERNPLFRLALGREDFVTREVRTLMAEFGAEIYSVPPEFTERIRYYLDQYQGPDRPIMARALGLGQRNIRTIREMLIAEQLPPDLAYIPVVETAMTSGQSSAAGAAGPWQFTQATAKAFGLRVDDKVDERLDLRKSTRAGCKYLRELILDFGAGSSVMLALAAYNSGPTKVKQAVMKTVRDPIKQRNFWYLYRTRALPSETREYVPKVVAVMIIGRNPGRFGFSADAESADREGR